MTGCSRCGAPRTDAPGAGVWSWSSIVPVRDSFAAHLLSRMRPVEDDE